MPVNYDRTSGVLLCSSERQKKTRRGTKKAGRRPWYPVINELKFECSCFIAFPFSLFSFQVFSALYCSSRLVKWVRRQLGPLADTLKARPAVWSFEEADDAEVGEAEVGSTEQSKDELSISCDFIGLLSSLVLYLLDCVS